MDTLGLVLILFSLGFSIGYFIGGYKYRLIVDKLDKRITHYNKLVSIPEDPADI